MIRLHATQLSKCLPCIEASLKELICGLFNALGDCHNVIGYNQAGIGTAAIMSI